MSDLIFNKLGEQILELIQNFSNPILDLYFGVATTFGNTLPILIIIILVYYNFNKEYMSKLIYLLIISVHLNNIAKVFFHSPRPFQYDEKYRVTTSILRETTWGADGFSFPSGHSQTQGTLWGYVFHKYKNLPVILLGLVFLVSVPLSRSYLGVHWPGDILVGVLFGVLIAVIFIQVDSRYGNYFSKTTDKQKIIYGFLGGIGLYLLGLATLLVTVMIFGSGLYSDLWLNSDLGVYPGIFAGMVTGQVIEKKYIGFQIRGKEWKSIVIRGVTGFVAVVILYLFTKVVAGLFKGFQETLPWIFSIADFFSYFILAFSLAYIVPLIFSKMEAFLYKD
ncbi:MAG: phosphatase PAP2 family protein [Candidatus Hodarchaeales archaeon]